MAETERYEVLPAEHEVVTASNASAGEPVRQPSLVKVVWDFLRHDHMAFAGAVIYVFFGAMALLAPWIAPYPPDAMLQENGQYLLFAPPSLEHLLGTTSAGRDVFSQLVYGARPTLIVGFTAALLVVAVGTVVGLIAGFYGGWVDDVLMRLTDVAFGIPFEPFVIVLIAFTEPSIWNIVLAMGLLLWRDTARVVRSQVLTLKERSYVEAAVVQGATPLRILFVHIAPNVLPISLLYGSFAIGWAILTEASLSFLGFGDPASFSWGFMLQDAYVSQALSREAYYWFIPPGVCIMLTVMAGFFLSRGAEEHLFPRLRQE